MDACMNWDIEHWCDIELEHWILKTKLKHDQVCTWMPA